MIDPLELQYHFIPDKWHGLEVWRGQERPVLLHLDRILFDNVYISCGAFHGVSCQPHTAKKRH